MPRRQEGSLAPCRSGFFLGSGRTEEPSHLLPLTCLMRIVLTAKMTPLVQIRPV